MTRRLALIIAGLIGVAAIDGSISGPTMRTAILTIGYLCAVGLVCHIIDRPSVSNRS